MSPPDWFDFATLLTLWILCFQYGFNHFVSPLYKARLLQRDGLPEAEAQEATNRLIGRMRWFVLVVLILSVVFGTYGFITSPGGPSAGGIREPDRAGGGVGAVKDRASPATPKS